MKTVNFNSLIGTTPVLFKILDFYFLIIAPIFKNSREMKLGGFQGSQFSQVFEPLVFRGGSHEMVITILISKRKS